MSAPIVRSGAKIIEFVDKYDVQKRKERLDRRVSSSRKPTKQFESSSDQIRDVKEEFQETMDEVLEFGVAGLRKRERKEHEKRKLVKLGCKVEKDPKMPYRILQSMRATHIKREEQRRKELKQSKVVAAKLGNGTSFTGGRFATAADKNKQRKRKKREVDIHSTDVGRLRNGILHLNKSGA